MKPLHLRCLLFTLPTLLSPALACKCMDPDHRDIKNQGTTEFCCRHMYGNAWMSKGPGMIDCEAWSISNELANFSDCCGSGKRKLISDCPCSHGCRSLKPPAGAKDGEEDAEVTVEMKKPADPTASMEEAGGTTRIVVSAETPVV